MITTETLARPSPKETVMALYDAFDQGALRRFCGIAAPFEAGSESVRLGICGRPSPGALTFVTCSIAITKMP
jgi:hypothetical protein